MKKQFVVIGMGRFGKSVALTLSNMGYDVLAIDKHGERVQEVVEFVTHAVTADATDENILKTLGIRNFDVAVVAIAQDTQDSILVTILLKEMGVGYVLAKAMNDLHGRVLSKIGADKVVFPERDMGVRVARSLVGSNIVDYIELDPDFSIIEIESPSEFIGKSLRQLDLRVKYGFNVLAIKCGKNIIVSPQADYVLEKDDILVVVGKNGILDRLGKKQYY